MKRLCLLMLLSLAACAPTMTTSTPMLDANKVNQIEKGKSTMPEVEALLGKPSFVTMMGDGKRMAFYSGMTMLSSAQVDPKTFIPIVGPFVATTNGQSSVRQQSLQIVYTADNVVQDYQFNDTTTNGTSSVNVISGAHMEVGPAMATPGSSTK
jgi:hypothetical protein